MDKLFEAFAQTETGRHAQEGTGLGLPISKKFVQLMGGDITVKSKVGKGTTFTFEIQVGPVDQLTLDTQQSKISKRVIALEPNQPRYRILIVDDKPDNRKVLMKFLSKLSSPLSGFELREAATGQEAISICNQWEPHMIWMDLRMPIMDGYEATKRIREVERRTSNIERDDSEFQVSSFKFRSIIIAVSASFSEEEREVALSKGCDDFLRKPFREMDIFDLMHKHLGVRFVYEESNRVAGSKVAGSRQQAGGKEVLTPDALAGLPNELQTGLQQAVERIDLTATKRLIEQIRQHNPALADTLAELVNNYRFDRLQELFEEI
jgi:CheY-like chemotaxis protein